MYYRKHLPILNKDDLHIFSQCLECLLLSYLSLKKKNFLYPTLQVRFCIMKVFIDCIQRSISNVGWDFFLQGVATNQKMVFHHFLKCGSLVFL